AAKKWADPNTRWDFLNYSHADWQSMWDATVKGAIGGGALGGLISTVVSTPIDPHPDPQVRTDIKDIQQRANDVPIKNPDETPDHVELSGLLNKEKILNQNINSGKLPEDQLKLAQADLQQNLAQQEVIKKKLGLLTDETGGAAATTTTTVPLVNQSSSDAAKLEELKKTFTAPTREPGATVLLDPNREAVKNKQADIEAHIESVAGGTEYGQKLKEAITPDIVNMMAAEDVHLRSETDPNVKPEDRRAFALSMEKDGSLSLYVPTATDPEAAHAMATEGGLHVAIAHELAHVADFVNVRREWKAGDQSVPVRTFTEERMRQRGESARKSEAFLPAVAKAGYDTGKLGKMSDVELGMEIPRMAIEIARLGKTSEVTDALSRAAQKDFKAKPFFRDWINALQRIHGFIQKFIDPQTANPEILKAVNDMHATLDEYGLLVNQKPAEAAPLTTPEVTPKVEPTAPNAPPVVAPTPTRYSNAEMRKMDAAELRKHANEVGVPPSDIPQSRKDVMAAIKEQYAKEDAKTEAAAPAPPVEAPAPPAPAVLPSQQTPAAPAVPEVPKGPSPYKIFRAAIKEGKGPTEVANKYLDLLQSKNDLPSTKMEIAAAHIDLQNRHSGLVMSRERFTELAKEHIKKQQNETKLKQQQQAAAEGTQLTAKKASVTEPNQPEDVAGHEGDLSGDTGTEERYDHPISEQLAHKASSARPGNKLKEMRSYLAEHRPELVPHFDNVVQEAGRSNIDEEAARRI
ncbi:MAG TPA: hypothetical protein VNS88_11760, partial [Nitrospiraceae bacterium]|nr:hypothetical protein [Nitrospiraceae bacterium]